MPPLGHFSLIRFGKIAADADRSVRRASRPPADAADAQVAQSDKSRVRTTTEDNRCQAFCEELRDAALGRPPLLSPQPHQPVAAPGQRDLASSAPMCWCSSIPPVAALIGWLVAMTDAPGRPLLLRAEGLRPHQPGDARAQGRDQGRLQSAAQGRAADDLGAVAAAALSRSDAVRPVRAAQDRRRNSSATSR